MDSKTGASDRSFGKTGARGGVGRGVGLNVGIGESND